MATGYRVVFNDCAAPDLTGITHVYTRPGGFGQQNFVFAFDGVIGGLPERLTPVQLDWLTILSALYATDISCRRGTGMSWAREIEVWIGVREPDHWRPLADHFRRVFSALTYDNIDIHFECDLKPDQRPRQRTEAFPAADSVALVSGGLDSLTGTGLLLASGHRPLLISHQNSGVVGRALAAVDQGLATVGAVAERVSFTARLENIDGDSSQRSRSMLYMGIACLVAACMNITEVYLNENGVMAIHTPLTEARAGSFSTRTANPRIARELGRLASTALSRTVTIQNSLIAMTKPEVVRAATKIGLGPTVRDTVSCWSIGRTGVHCGYCVPCLIRKISCEFAEVPDAEYTRAPFDAIPPNASWAPTAKDNLVQLIAHAISLNASDSDLELDFMDLMNGGDQIIIEDCYDMHRRWSAQCLAVAAAHPWSAAIM